MPHTLESYIDAGRDRFLEELFALLRIPSISTAPEHKADVNKAAGFVSAALSSVGMENVEVIKTDGHPLVYGDWLHAPGKPTVLCYGHYDVQPPDPLDEWVSPPFEPTLRDGNIYARGSSDDKGQFFTHLKAVETLRAVHAELPLNVRFLIEGEEEVGGESITQYVQQNGERLRADVALVSDTAMYAEGVPTLCTGLRGLLYMEIEARGPAKDLHSGNYGGVAPNAVFGLIELLAKAKNAEGVLQIPSIYDEVAQPADAEKQSWDGLGFDEAEFLRNEVGSTCLTGEPGHSALERIWARPTFEVHGIGGGFTGPGSKTVIPARATAKVSVRLVPDQNLEKVVAAVREFVRNNTPVGIETEVRTMASSPAVLADPQHPAVRTAAEAFSEALGKPTVYIRCGGSVPIVGDLARHLGMPTVMLGLGLPDDSLHSPNEKFRLQNFYTGIRTVARFFEKYAEGQAS